MKTGFDSDDGSTSKGDGADAFDKALALANFLADRERESLTGSYDRFFQLVKSAATVGSVIVVVSAAILAFFGFKTVTDLSKQMNDSLKSQVAADMPKMVRDQVSQQFESDHVRSVAENEIRKESGRQIQQLVESEVSKAVALEIKRQKLVIRLAVNDEIVHHLSLEQSSALISFLKNIGHQSIKFNVNTNHNSNQYTNELANAFIKAGWSLQGEGNANALLPVTGSTLYISKLTVNADIADGPEIAQRLVVALKKSDLPTSFEGTDKATVRGGAPCFTLQIQEVKDKNISSPMSDN